MSDQYSKQAVHYVDDHGDSTEQCSKCVHFHMPDKCDVVIGHVVPGGWCDEFKRKRRPGNA